ncbi:MAG: winged helix-turn-helix transcriptional regulator [Acidimicrobiia bacterium]
MATTRTYRDACAIARALDVVGARWALLVVRELLLGPLRFSELVRALPGASTNMLSDRLRELAEAGVIHRRRLPPPANTAVYELSDWGRELEPVVLALGAWGLRVPRAPHATLSPTSVLLFLRGSADIDAATPNMVIRLVLDERAFTVTVRDRQVHVDATEPGASDVSLTCSPTTLYDLLSGDLDISTAIDDGRAAIDGDQSRLRSLTATIPNPG